MSLSMNVMSLVRPHERDDLDTATFQNATFRFPHRFSPVLLAEPALGRSSPLGAVPISNGVRVPEGRMVRPVEAANERPGA